MKVVEEFMTVQGEGRYVGMPSYFIRTTGCNLRCEWKNPDNTTTKCDTPYTSWAPERGYDLDLSGVVDKLKKTKTQHVVITGGEPTMQRDLPIVANRFADEGFRVTIETNGTIYHPNMERAFISMSPKLLDSYGQDPNTVEASLHRRNNNWQGASTKWMQSNPYQMKFVVNSPNDLEEVLTWHEVMKIPAENIYLMPQGISKEQFAERQQMIFDAAVQYGFNYCPRLHIEIFGNKRGV